MGKYIQIYMDDDLNENITNKSQRADLSKKKMIVKILESYFKEEVQDEG